MISITSLKYYACVLRVDSVEFIEGKKYIHKAILSDGSIVIVPVHYAVGMIGLYFKTGTNINQEFLSANNLFDKPELNRCNIRGSFSSSGKVKRRAFNTELPVTGFFIDLDSLRYIGVTNFDKFTIGKKFNRIEENAPFIPPKRKSVKIKGTLQTEKILRFSVEEIKEYIKPLKDKNTVVGVFAVEPIIDIIKKEQTNVFINDRKVSVCSLRLRTFANNQTCVCCGAKPIYFRIQKPNPKGTKSQGWHLELYCQRPDGSIDIMTKDHILAFSKGGPDILKNMQTMCFTCNSLKGDS